MNRVHLIVVTPAVGHVERETACGMRGYLSRSSNDEYETWDGRRFEAVRPEKVSQVTCLRCKRKEGRE